MDAIDYTSFPDHRDLERKSSAVTLSDMEVFIFPELIYSLVLANLMSPRIWRWRDDPWFEGIQDMTPYRRMTRLKQYIMDHYAFNLDLDTWGLTTKQKEMNRFKDHVTQEALAQSNALFGYEGDKYYFDLDIRTHFGLDKYEGDVIPYWKTETVEAMDAFQYKAEYDFGAGECVSLATLYAAALFVVARIPLSDIYLMATPLHSQNFVDTGQGILTNNRRLVTKNMWFNGSALSAQARRALENERVTVVAHESGCIHVLFPETTIDPAAYERFSKKLRRFLQTPLTPQVLGNFIRHSSHLQPCFQVRWHSLGSDHYIAIERLLEYERSFPYRFNDDTRDRLMKEVAGEDFSARPLPGRMVLDDIEDLIHTRRIDLSDPQGFSLLVHSVGSDCLRAQDAIEGLRDFCFTDPRLPDAAQRTFTHAQAPLDLEPHMNRSDVLERLQSLRTDNRFASLAFYAYRDLNDTEPAPFLKAALERCPVSVTATSHLKDEELVSAVDSLPGDSIYDGPGRLAQPDEVWNYRRGDGVEKALLLANVLRARHPEWRIRISVDSGRASLQATASRRGTSGTAETLSDDGLRCEFPTDKALTPQLWDCNPPSSEPAQYPQP